MYRGFPIGDWKGPVAKNYYFFRNGRSGRPGNCRLRKQEKSPRGKCPREVSLVDRIKGKETGREIEMEIETKLMKKKKEKKMGKNFFLLRPREISTRSYSAFTGSIFFGCCVTMPYFFHARCRDIYIRACTHCCVFAAVARA